MTAVMQGVRILEVAEHTFVPAASALLADWGAEVIKIEHPRNPDPMRGLMTTTDPRDGAIVDTLFDQFNPGATLPARAGRFVGEHLVVDDPIAEKGVREVQAAVQYHDGIAPTVDAGKARVGPESVHIDQ